MAAPQVRSPGGNRANAEDQSTDGQIIAPHAVDEKRFHTLRAHFALRGHTLRRTDPSDGPVSLYAERWGLVRYLPSLDDAQAFLAQIGGRA